MPKTVSAKDPLTLGPSKTWSVYTTVALKKEIERQAAIDGYEKLNEYVIELLSMAVRIREAERHAK